MKRPRWQRFIDDTVYFYSCGDATLFVQREPPTWVAQIIFADGSQFTRYELRTLADAKAAAIELAREHVAELTAALDALDGRAAKRRGVGA